ncbi:MAG: hypothetical protein L6R39_006957, partial [Caloplaca ligustica]
MPSKKLKPSPKSTLPFKTGNRERRQKLHITRKKALDNTRRDERFRRRREEDKDPSLREQRLRQNIPLTLERKRVWDEIDSDAGDGLGVSIDVERLKRQKHDDEAQAGGEDDHSTGEGAVDAPDPDNDRDSMIDSASDSDESPTEPPKRPSRQRSATDRATSPT